MKPLSLNFSPHQNDRRDIAAIVMIAFCCILLLALFYAQQQMDKNNANQLVPDYPSEKVKGVKGSLAESALQKQIQEAKRLLDLPWSKIFEALEKAQISNPSVHLLSIQPNAQHGDILMTGEVENFNKLLDYVNTLKAQPIFIDVVLVNQRLTDEASKKSRLSFTLQVQWKS